MGAGCSVLVLGYRVLGTGYWVLGTGYWVLRAGDLVLGTDVYWVLGAGFWVLGTRHWGLNNAFLTLGSGYCCWVRLCECAGRLGASWFRLEADLWGVLRCLGAVLAKS